MGNGRDQFVGGGAALGGHFAMAEAVVQFGHVAQHAHISGVEAGGGVDIGGDAFEEMPGVAAEIGQAAIGHEVFLVVERQAVEMFEEGLVAHFLVEERPVASDAQIGGGDAEEHRVVGHVAVAEGAVAVVVERQALLQVPLERLDDVGPHRLGFEQRKEGVHHAGVPDELDGSAVARATGDEDAGAVGELVAEGQQQVHHAHVIIAAQGRVLGLQHGQVAFEKAVVRGEDLRIALFPELLGVGENGVKPARPARGISGHAGALAKGHHQINGLGFAGGETKVPSGAGPGGRQRSRSSGLRAKAKTVLAEVLVSLITRAVPDSATVAR